MKILILSIILLTMPSLLSANTPMVPITLELSSKEGKQKILFNGVAKTFDQVEKILKAALGLDPRQPVIIRSEMNVPISEVISIYLLARKIGAKDFTCLIPNSKEGRTDEATFSEGKWEPVIELPLSPPEAR